MVVFPSKKYEMLRIVLSNIVQEKGRFRKSDLLNQREENGVSELSH